MNTTLWQKHPKSSIWKCSPLVPILLFMFAHGVQKANAQFDAHGIGASTVADSGQPIPRLAHVGDTVTIRLIVVNEDGFNDAQRITNIVLEINQAIPTDTGNLIPSLGGPFTLLLEDDLRAFANIATYVVQPDDPDSIVHVFHVDSHDLGNNLLQEADPRADITVLRPCISITKECDYPEGQTFFTPGNPIHYKGVVCNTGNTPLEDILVVDTPEGPIVPGSDVFMFASLSSDGRVYDGTLNPNECIEYFGSYMPAVSSQELCGFLYDSVVAYGTDGLGLTVSSLTECTQAGVGSTGTRSIVRVGCEVVSPQICVTKEVACLEQNGVCGPYGDTATGVKVGEDCPTFCYRFVVTNCGCEDLTNITLSDDHLDLSGCTIPSILGVGESFECVVKTELCYGILNTVEAQGTGTRSNIRTNNFDNAMVTIKSAAVVCDIILTSSFDMDKNNCEENMPPMDSNPCDNHLLLPAGFIGEIGFYVTVTNPGEATLENIQLVGLPPECIPEIPPSLPPGASFTVACYPVVSCPEGASYHVDVYADVSDENGTVCVYDRNGKVIDVSSYCEAEIDCIAPVACRTTGGGKQYASAVIDGAADDEIPASLFPANADYVTHGGQVGAPFGAETVFEPNAECVRGQWEHVRHGSDGSEGNFHSAYFDSLMCACLGCTDPQTGQWLAPMVLSALCNPDNRVCGPEPRRAPANAICFSGVGNWSEGKGRKGQENVVFRVYIEDRSEPGGSPPGRHHADDPPDVYSIQIWSINGNPDSPQNLALREAISASSIGEGINVPAAALAIRAPDLNDSGVLGRGNHQIHPSTKATCP